MESLRERKKRETRQLISDRATEMFLERGFDAVRVAEVAAACGVSEKTVYNYFPTKESLLLDRQEAMLDSLSRALGAEETGVSAVEAAVRVIEEDMAWLTGEFTDAASMNVVFRFGRLIDETPSLASAQRDMMDRMVEAAAEALAERSGVSAGDPEPRIAATAIVGLWQVQWAALHRHIDGARTPEQVRQKVGEDVRRAARLLEGGLWASTLVLPTTGSREQVKAAADAASQAKKQLAVALQQAKAAWREAAREHHASTRGEHHELKRAARAEHAELKRAARETAKAAAQRGLEAGRRAADARAAERAAEAEERLRRTPPPRRP